MMRAPKLPFLSNPSCSQTTQDAQAWAQAVCVTTPVRICEPLFTSKPFQIESAVLNLGEVMLVSTQGSAITLATEQHHSAQLLIPYDGLGVWKVEREIYQNPMGESILYLPQAPLFLENDRTSGVALNFSPAVLMRTALIMAGPAGLPPQRLAVFGQPHKLRLGDPHAGPLIHSLYSFLESLSHFSSFGTIPAELLCLDDVLTRIVILLLLPELLHNQARKNLTGSVGERRRLQPLLDWIDANLVSPISLSDLESHAHMSRRNLQYAFRRAFDCTPMQWVRRRRLDIALLRLKQRQSSDSLATISRELGFMNSATFSRDFRRQFGCTPSSIRRDVSPP